MEKFGDLINEFPERVNCLFVPSGLAPTKSIEIEPYKGVHEIFNAIVGCTNGSVAKTKIDKYLMWIDDDGGTTRKHNDRASEIAGTRIYGHAVLFGSG